MTQYGAPAPDPWASPREPVPAPRQPALPPVVTQSVYQPHQAWLAFGWITAGLVTLLEVAQVPLAMLAQHSVFFDDAPLDGSAALELFALFAYFISSVAVVGALALAYVANCLWLWRARTNADVFAPLIATRRKGWVWAGWLVPIVALWFPMQVVRDVRLAGAPAARQRPLVGWWWASWLAFLVADRVASAQFSGDEEVETLPVVWEAVGAACAVVALVLWVVVTRAIAREQDEVARERGLLPF